MTSGITGILATRKTLSTPPCKLARGMESALARRVSQLILFWVPPILVRKLLILLRYRNPDNGKLEIWVPPD